MLPVTDIRDYTQSKPLSHNQKNRPVSRAAFIFMASFLAFRYFSWHER